MTLTDRSMSSRTEIEDDRFGTSERVPKGVSRESPSQSNQWSITSSGGCTISAGFAEPPYICWVDMISVSGWEGKRGVVAVDGGIA